MSMNIVKSTWNAAKTGAKSIGMTGRGVYGAGKGSSTYMYDLASLGWYSQDRLKRLQATIEKQALQYAAILNSRKRSVDALAVGGELLADMIRSGRVPVDVQTAFEAAYPNLAERMDFSGAVDKYHGQSLTDFLSPIKGKLFEGKYADWLNHGNLPDGYHANLARMAGESGWHLEITGPNSTIVDLLQTKATDSVSYVSEAIDRYPDIQVISTDEVFSKIVMHGASHSSVDITDIANQVDFAAHPADVHMDFTPPLIALALIAFTTYCNPDLSDYAKAQEFGERGAKTYLTYLFGGVVALITQTWWLGIIAGIGSRWLAGQGRKKREIHHELKTLIARNKRILLTA